MLARNGLTISALAYYPNNLDPDLFARALPDPRQCMKRDGEGLRHCCRVVAARVGHGMADP
jgi:hypothetical protein